MDQLKDILQDTRTKNGWNKSQMARAIGISSQLYGQYEKGEKVPGGDFFVKWKRVFGTDLASEIETNVWLILFEDDFNRGHLFSF